MAILTLSSDVKANGLDQKSLIELLTNIVTVVNELQDDHATNKTTIDECRTAIIELIDDHDADRAGIITDLKTLTNNIRTYLTGDRLWSGNPALAIDTNFDVQSAAACVVSIDGTLATVGAATCDTGTAATLAGSTWGVFLVSSDSAGSLTATWDTNSGSGYASEALAIAALPAAPASEAPIGYVTVQAHASGFTAGTDALTTGTGGNVATATNYYNLADPASTITAAISSSAAVALSAGDPTASAGALTNGTNLVLTEG